MQLKQRIAQFQIKHKLGKAFEPQYGYYCGTRRRCMSREIQKYTGVCPPPIDEVDRLCAQHDYDDNHKDPWADFKLLGRILRTSPFIYFARPVYGRLYAYLGIPIIIGIRGLLTTPYRLLRHRSDE